MMTPVEINKMINYASGLPPHFVLIMGAQTTIKYLRWIRHAPADRSCALRMARQLVNLEGGYTLQIVV